MHPQYKNQYKLFHLPLQSGSDRILSEMNRKYTRDSFFELCDYARRVVPDIYFTTDIIVGFPGESEEEFSQTLDFVRKARFLDAHVFTYSKREGTEAFDFDFQIENRVKDQRSKILRLLVCEIRAEILLEIINKKEQISALVETREGGYYTAHSPSYLEIKFPDNGEDGLCGKVVKVHPVSQKDGVLYCTKE